MKKIALGLVLALIAGMTALVSLVLIVGSAGLGNAASCDLIAPVTGPAASAAAGSSSTPGSTPTAPGLPRQIGKYQGEQIANAGQIILAAQDLGLDAQAQTIGVMTAIGESTLRNLDRGDNAGPDSRGVFQQRDNGAWGSYQDRMNPRIAATNFFKKLVEVSGWHDMPPTIAAHTVQRNSDPYHYERFWPDAVQIVSVLTGDPDLASKLPASGAVACVPGGTAGTISGPGGSFPPESCSNPDPTRTGGCLTGRMLNIANQLLAQGWSTSCWDAHAWNPSSDHPKGKACDVFPGKGGVLPTPEEKANGDALAASLQSTAGQTGINYIIWYGRIWNAGDPPDAWHPYTGGGVYDPSDITGGHFDHLHISVH